MVSENLSNILATQENVTDMFVTILVLIFIRMLAQRSIERIMNMVLPM